LRWTGPFTVAYDASVQSQAVCNGGTQEEFPVSQQHGTVDLRKLMFQ